MGTREENKRRLASRIVIISSVLLCSVASGFFAWAGASVGGGIIGKWPEFVWAIWGIAWGAICGGVMAYLLIKFLLKERKTSYGLLFGLGAGFIIGLVNGVLTGTAVFGVIIGVVLGPVPGLILAWIFLKVYKPKIKEGGYNG